MNLPSLTVTKSVAMVEAVIGEGEVVSREVGGATGEQETMTKVARINLPEIAILFIQIDVW